MAGSRSSLHRLPSPSLLADRGPATSLHLLGGFSLTDHGSPVSLAASAQRLVAFLGLRSRSLRRGYVAGILWSESEEERATGSLRSALWRLRRPGVPLVEASGSEVGLGSQVRVDYRDALELIHRLDEGRLDPLGPGSGRFRFDLLTQDLLPDWYEDWVAAERECFRQLRLHALETLCRRYADAGLFGRAVEAGLTAVQAEPLRESAHRALMMAYSAEGNRGEAIRQYRWYRRILREELGGRPSPQMEELVRSLDAAR